MTSGKPEIHKKACQAIRSGLEKRLRRPNDHPPFFLEDDIQQSWAEAGSYLIRDFLEPFNIFPDYQAIASTRFIKVMSILIWIGISDWQWQTISVYFRNHLEAVDLPLSKASGLFALLENWSLESAFRTAQYMFLPLTITENKNLGETPDECPLPFLESRLLMQDVHQTVTKELIAAKHLRRERGGALVANHSPVWMACKRRDTSQGFNLDERESIKFLKASSAWNEHIMLSFTTFFHGEYQYTLSDPIDCDLTDLLNGQCTDFESHADEFTTKAILEQACNIAGALHFLHAGVEAGGRTLVFAYLNLNSEHIAVTWRIGCPVGHWQITSVGMSDSTMHKPSGSSATTAARMVSKSTSEDARRLDEVSKPTSRWRSNPPTDYRRKDVASLGYLLAVTVAFAHDGPDAIRRLHLERARRPTYDAYSLEANGAGDAQLKQLVHAYRRVVNSSAPWLQKASALVLEILLATSDEALQAVDVQNQLKRILVDTALDALTDRCEWVGGGSIRKIYAPSVFSFASDLTYVD